MSSYKTPTKKSSVEFPVPLLIIFDIDETLIQFMGKNAYKNYWLRSPKAYKKDLCSRGGCIDNKKNQNCILLRPHLSDFFRYVMSNRDRVKVALWTYSEQEYSVDIASKLICHFGLPYDFFLFTYGAEQIDDEKPKALSQIWKDFPQYNKFNTILMDDRYKNLSHRTNRLNSILVQAFAPFGETKPREPITPALFEKSQNDDIMLTLVDVCKKLIKDIDGCEEEDVVTAFRTESVLDPRLLVRKKLEFLYPDETLGLASMGEVENAKSELKGGKRRTHRKLNKKRNTRKNVL